jgi:hypothetical protein
VNLRVSLGHPHDLLKHVVEGELERLAKSPALSFVPSSRFGEVRFRLRQDDQRQTHESPQTRDLTSSQLDPASGLASWAMSRRSSSSIWASVSGTSSGSVAMLSQISSTSKMRSSTLSRSIPSDFIVDGFGDFPMRMESDLARSMRPNSRKFGESFAHVAGTSLARYRGRADLIVASRPGHKLFGLPSYSDLCHTLRIKTV